MTSLRPQIAPAFCPDLLHLNRTSLNVLFRQRSAVASSQNHSAATTSPGNLQPVIITVGDGPAFRPIREWLETAVPRGQLRHFSTLQAALQAVSSNPRLPDLAIVFRSWCDEHPQTLVQQFIGRLFFRRIICCEGPLCVSEARTHQLWPASCRTSLSAAPVQIALRLNHILTGRPNLSPLAAPEDVFAFQASAAAASQPDSAPPLRTLVLVADAVLRQTISELLKHCGIPSEIGNAAVLQQLARDSSASQICAIVDADQHHGLDASLQQLKQRGARVVGLTGFPGSALPAWATEQVDKTELALRLSSLQLPPLSSLV